MNQVQLAKQIAVAAHAQQMYGSKPYAYHLQSVHDTLVFDFGQWHNPDLLAAAWLHDVLEDTAESPMSLLDSGVNAYVLALVDAVTDQAGKSREARHLLTYPRVVRLPEAVALKLADRIANCRNSGFMRKDKMEMYRREHRGFRQALFVPPQWQNQWALLDDLLGFGGEFD